jgi:hypothetical protein
MAEHSHENHQTGGGGYGRWIFWGFLLIAGYFLITEHRAHVVPYLPFLLLAACPLMHLFHGHGGHGGHGGDAASTGPGDKKKSDRPSDSGQHHH